MEIGFTIVFAFCAIILLLLMRFTSIHWVVKAGIILSSIAIVFLFYYSLIDMLGYPVATSAPSSTLLIKGSDIREPSKTSKGVIFLWYIVYGVDDQLPRAIRLPYSKDLHKKLTEASEQARKGKQVFMKFSNEKQKQDTGQEPSSDEESNAKVDFVMPPSHVPPKVN